MQTFIVLFLGAAFDYKIGLLTVSFVYIFGLLWLGYLIGWDKPIFKFGAHLFLLAELFKLLLLVILSPYIKKLKKII